MVLILVFVAAFLFSCTDTSDLRFPSEEEVRERGNGYAGGQKEPSSPSVAPSSSGFSPPPSSPSVKSSSSGFSPPLSSPDVKSSSSGFSPPPSSPSVKPSSSSIQSGVVYYMNETYETVEIGTQIWFKRNLNYNVSGSLCYNNEPTNCDKYGKLYNWATAMGLDATCNSSTCASHVQTNHKGICPQGWHIPSYDEWTTLMNFAEYADKKLRATSGWDQYNGFPPVGTDDYGFSALPGGYSRGGFKGVGYASLWWTSEENKDSGANFACGLGLDLNPANGDTGGGIVICEDKTNLYSVRCLKDD